MCMKWIDRRLNKVFMPFRNIQSYFFVIFKEVPHGQYAIYEMVTVIGPAVVNRACNQFKSVHWLTEKQIYQN